MARWADLENEAPAIAEKGHALLYQYGIGLAFLATIRGDGGPRLHPICRLSRVEACTDSFCRHRSSATSIETHVSRCIRSGQRIQTMSATSPVRHIMSTMRTAEPWSLRCITSILTKITCCMSSCRSDAWWRSTTREASGRRSTRPGLPSPDPDMAN
jgi:hypothetical protein